MSVSNSQALRALANYLAAHQLDNELKNVSLAELEAARGHVSPEADRIIDVLTRRSAAYTQLRGMQTEGRFNDERVSLRDMYAAARGTGYGGEDVRAKQATLFRTLATRLPPPGLFPDEIRLQQNFGHWGVSFTIKGADGRKLGEITEKVTAWTKTFTLTGADGRVIATARTKPFSWGVQIDVVDAQNRPIGGIKEKLFVYSWQPNYTQYEITGPNGQHVATSEKTQWTDTNIVMTRDGQRIVTLNRPWASSNGYESWNVTLADQSVIDPRVALMTAAFKSVADFEREEEAEERKRDEEEEERRAR